MAQGDLHCPSCSDTDPTVLFKASNGYDIVRCKACRLAFTDAREAPPPDSLYPHFDQSKTFALNRARSALSVFLRQRAAVVSASKTGGRLLDYGCGNGSFASWMAEEGFEVVGLEPFSLGAPRTAGRLSLYREPLESAAPKLGRFDVITLWHVLEHVPRPVELLRALHGHLADDGVLIVSVPNFESLQSEVFRGSWFHLDPPRHLVHFEEDTLRDCFARAGLETVRESPFLPEYGSSGWVQSALNQVLPHHNYLYEFVKDRGALRSMPAASSALHLAASLVLSAPVFAASLPVEAVASRMHKGAALTFAVRATRTAVRERSS
jgi:SAM-dependent methyltransferase